MAGLGDLHPAAGVAGAWASRRSRSTPTSSTCAARRAARGSRPDAARRWAPTSTTPAGRAAPTRRSRDRRLRRQAGAVGRRRELERVVHDDPAGRRRTIRGAAEEPAGLRRRLAGDPGPARQGHAVRRGQRHRAAGTGRHRTAQRRRPQRGPHGDRLRQGQGRDVRLPRRQLHAGPDPGSVPRPWQRHRDPARRWRLVGDRAATRHRRHVGGRRCTGRKLRHPSGAVRLPRARAARAGLRSTDGSAVAVN